MVPGMSLVISLIMTVMNTGIENGFAYRWLPAWAMSFLSFPGSAFYNAYRYCITDKLVSYKISKVIVGLR